MFVIWSSWADVALNSVCLSCTLTYTPRRSATFIVAPIVSHQTRVDEEEVLLLKHTVKTFRLELLALEKRSSSWLIALISFCSFLSGLCWPEFTLMSNSFSSWVGVNWLCSLYTKGWIQPSASVPTCDMDNMKENILIQQTKKEALQYL